MSAAAIKLLNLGKSFVEGGITRLVLRDLSLELEHGQMIAIQGRSGSGKTTLLNLIAGLDQPDKGDIYIHGQAITRLDEQQRTLFRRRHLGFVFQGFNLIPTLTVAENLLFPLELNRIGGDQAVRKMKTILELFGLEDRMDSFPDQLSGGEQQRVAIARAIVHKPSIVLADEPTGNLDLDTEKQVLGYLRSLPAAHDVTVICATHSREIARLADSIYLLEEGDLHGQ